MKIIITGANGMLGSSLSWLYQFKHEVNAFHRNEECFSDCVADYSLDLTDSTQLKTLFNRIKPDLLIHCAGLTNVDVCEKNPELAFASNVTVPENVAWSCPTKTKLVYISTDQVYGVAVDHSENNMDLQPVNQYGETKYLGEKKCLEHSPDCIIIRTNIFGWNVKPSKVSFAEWIYSFLKKGREITLFDDYTFSPIYTESLGVIIMQLVEMGFTGVINAGSPVPCSKYEFGSQLAEKFDFSQSLIKKGSIVNHSFEAPRPNNLTLNVQRLTGLGVIAPDYVESINKFKRNNPRL